MNASVIGRNIHVVLTGAVGRLNGMGMALTRLAALATVARNAGEGHRRVSDGG
jgi:hypothetical protein